jgi:hypothetical protein
MQGIICTVAPVSNNHSSVLVRTDLQMAWLILRLRRSAIMRTPVPWDEHNQSLRRHRVVPFLCTLRTRNTSHH